MTMSKKAAVLEYDDAEFIVEHNEGFMPSCYQCVISKPECHDCCQLVGNAYHVSHARFYGFWRTLYRKIKFILLSHY